MNRDRYKLLSWLAVGICMFVLLYGISYLALLSLPPYEGVDMTSQLVADYSPWDTLVFQPVDPAIIEEIKQERDLPEQVVIDGLFWPTPISSNTVPSNIETQQPSPITTAENTLSSSPQATSDDLPSSPTTSQPPYNSTPQPTSITSPPEPTATLEPITTPQPTRSRTPPKDQKPPKDHKPPKDSKPPKNK